MDILLVHDRDYLTIMEKSLRYIGIENYSVVRPHLPRGVWRNTLKLPAMLAFAENSRSKYILYVDSDDAVMTGDPARAIALLGESGRDMLISATAFKNYHHFPHMEAWFERLAAERGYASTKVPHPCSGVFVARREFLIDFLRAASAYVTDDDLPVGAIGKVTPPMPGFPRRCGSDQIIFRFIFPRFADLIAIDYAGHLAFPR
jgi:hypothetical protein